MGEMADYLLEQADADVDGVLEAPRKTGGSKRHIHQQAQHKITPSCKWGLDACPFDVAHKQCSTCRCDKA